MKEGGRREGGRERGMEEGKKEEREGWRKGIRKREREGEREGGRERGMEGVDGADLKIFKCMEYFFNNPCPIKDCFVWPIRLVSDALISS